MICDLMVNAIVNGHADFVIQSTNLKHSDDMRFLEIIEHEKNARSYHFLLHKRNTHFFI